LELNGYGFTSETGRDVPTGKPITAMFYLDVALSAGNKDWAVMSSNLSTACRGDSGGPVMYYRLTEKALVLVGVASTALVSAETPDANCATSRFGTFSAPFTKLSSNSEMVASTLNTESRYRPSALVIDSAVENLFNYRTNVSDLSDFADQLPITTKKRLIDKSKNITALNRLIDEYEIKISDQEELLNESMEFTLLNSAILEANLTSLEAKFEALLVPYEKKFDALFTKISKTLPSFVCISDLNTKDLPSSKKCPKGYEKTELPKPF